MECSIHRQIYGVDFSGARDAGRKIWLAQGTADDCGLQINECYPAADLPGSGLRRDEAITALCDLIAGETDATFGLDFPFGLPMALVREESWVDFIRAFPETYSDAAVFREACRDAADGRELKRATDIDSRTPFSPYNLRIFRQTYHGISDVLHPLVRDDLARALPMQAPASLKPWVLEICPASTLKAEGLYAPYKGGSDDHRSARRQILEALEELGPTQLEDASVRSKLLDDPGGDALDSVIAAFAVFRALNREASVASGFSPADAIEGHVYY